MNKGERGEAVELVHTVIFLRSLALKGWEEDDNPFKLCPQENTISQRPISFTDV